MDPEEEIVDTQVADEPTETTEYEADSGMADLTAAFTADSQRQPAEEPAAPDEPEAPADAPATTATETRVPADILNDPEVQRLLEFRSRQAANDIIAERQAQARQAQEVARLQTMSDEEFGRFMRGRERVIAEQTQLQTVMAQQFYRGATEDVFRHIPEMEKLEVQDAAKLDPRKFDSYGKMMSAVVDHVAAQRATKVAEKLATEKFEAWKVSELAKLQAEYPKQPDFTQQGISGQVLDIDNATGRELLEAGFAQSSVRGRRHRG